MKKTGIIARVAGWFYDHPAKSAGLFILLIGFGILSYTTLIRREGFPSVDVPISVVNGIYPINNNQLVDEQAAKPFTEIVSKAEGVESVITTSDDNFFTLIAELNDNLSNGEGNQRIQDAIDQDGELPSELQINIIPLNAAKYYGQYDILLSLYDLDSTVENLENSANKLLNEFTELDEVTDAKIENLLQTGINPATGDSVTQQVSFGGVLFPGDDGLEYSTSITIGLTGQSGQDLDIFELSEAVHSKVDEFNATQQPGEPKLLVAADFSDSISGQISSLQENVITGMIAVTLISAILITWRVSLLTAFFMVSVIVVSIGVLFAFGYTLNTITLFALVLSLGLFVDDATIVSEAIDAGRSKSKKPLDIVKGAVQSVGMASLAGTLTTILVFVPLLFIGGVLGKFIFLLPLTVIIALVVSYVLSITLLPFLSRFSILTRRNKKTPKSWLDPVSESLSYMIRLLSSHKVAGFSLGFLAIIISFSFIILSGIYASKLSFNIFPNSKDSNEIVVSLSFDPGTDIEKAQQTSADVGYIIGDTLNDDVTRIVFGYAGSPNNRNADLLVELTPYDERTITAPQYTEKLEQELASVPGVNVQINQIDAGPPQEQFPFKVQVFSEDRQTLLSAADSIAQDLEGQEVELANGSSSEIVETEIARDDVIARKDGRQFVEVGAAYDSDDVSALVQATREEVREYYTAERLAELGLDSGALEFDFGQESENEESFAALGPAALIALVAMFVLLGLQFRSPIKPLLIFVALPFSLLGVTYGLYNSNNALSFFAMVGFIGLIGIAVNNTILLTDFANQERRVGKSPVAAIAEATRRRFRPLVTTTTTTVAALTPLALSDPFWEPLAITIMFGLVSSTILVIIAFPYYYLVEEYLTISIKKLLRRYK